jgi:hypothetical protein
MSGAIHPLPQYAFMAWCLVKAQGKLLLYLKEGAFLFFLASSPTISLVNTQGNRCFGRFSYNVHWSVKLCSEEVKNAWSFTSIPPYAFVV